MVVELARRMLTEPDPRALRKLVWNMGVKGVRSVQLYKQRLKRGEHFPPFLFISVISGCQLRCQGCWVDVEAQSRKIEIDELNRIVGDAKRHGNSYFGILGASRCCTRICSTCSPRTRTATSSSSPTDISSTTRRRPSCAGSAT